MRESVVHQVLLVLAVGMVLLVNLGAPQLWDEDEPKNAACTREMLERGDLVVPRFNYDLRTDKPILIYWLMMGSYLTLGVTELAARLPSALLGIGTVLLTYHIGRWLFRPWAGFWAALAIGTCLMFDVSARAATPDATLLFCTTLAMAAVARGIGRARDAGAQLPVPSIGHLAVAYAAMGLAVLAKGPVGVVLPTGIIGLYLLFAGVTRNPPPDVDPAHGWFRRWVIALQRVFAPSNVWWAIRTAQPLLAIAIVAAIALPWYVMVGERTDGEWLRGFLGKHNVDRFLKPMENHRGPIFYYLPAMMIGFFPWSVFLIPMFAHLSKRARIDENRFAYLLLACWFGLYIGFFSLASTKLPSYVLPAFPAMALTVGSLWDHWQRRAISLPTLFTRMACGVLATVGIAMAIALPIVAHRLLPGEEWLGVVGAIPIVGALATWVFIERDNIRAAQVSFATMAILLAMSVWGWGAVRVSRHQTSAALVALSERLEGPETPIASYQYSAPSLAYYARRKVYYFDKPTRLQEFLRQNPQAVLITREDRLPELAGAVPPTMVEQARERVFLKKDQLVLLGPSSVTAVTPRSPQAVK